MGTTSSRRLRSSRDTVSNSAECAEADAWDLGLTVFERWGHQGPWLVRLRFMSSQRD